MAQSNSTLQGGVAGSRVQEWREAEPSGEDQPSSSLIPGGDRPEGSPAGDDTTR